MVRSTRLVRSFPMPVIDHHDDLCESFLASVDPNQVSEIMKISSWRESADLLDRDFALILVDEVGKEHRKFACFDSGNALMSEWYLLNADHGLDSDSVKTAAANIVDSLEHYGLTPTPASVYLADRTAGADSRRVKVAGAPMSDSQSSIRAAKGGALGGAALGAISGAKGGGTPLQIAGRMLGRGTAAGTAGALGVGGMDYTAKNASAFDYVADAAASWDDLDPYNRHEVAVNLVKVASAGGATVPGHIYAYSGTSLNPNFKKIAEARRDFSSIQDVQDGYTRLSKMAAAMDPDDVVEAMYLLDEQAQVNHRYGSRIPDPVLSVYGTTKEAEYSWTHGGDYVNETMLKRYAGSDSSQKMEDVFTEDLKDLFRRDPVSVFKRMPDEQKILLTRMASQSRDNNNGGY